MNVYCPRPTLEILKSLIVAAGLHVGAGCWEEEDKVFAFSSELSRDTWGDSRLTIVWSNGWLRFIRG